MALKKKIRKPNGLELEYHRIAMVKIDTNQQTTILLHSYLNEEARNHEKAFDAGEVKDETTLPYIDWQYIPFEYDENMNITNAYEWLKQQPEFIGAIDV